MAFLIRWMTPISSKRRQWLSLGPILRRAMEPRTAVLLRMQRGDRNGTCTSKSSYTQVTVIITLSLLRHDLSVAQREEYIRAVLCLQSLPPKADKTKYPGVNNRYDDFVLTHEMQAMHLHSTVSPHHQTLRCHSLTPTHQPHLFPAHRLYVWAYEKALREECGYTGYQPVRAFPSHLLHVHCLKLLTMGISTGIGAAQPPTPQTLHSSTVTCPA